LLAQKKMDEKKRAPKSQPTSSIANPLAVISVRGVWSNVNDGCICTEIKRTVDTSTRTASDFDSDDHG
jgi:hypothetical protein